MDMDSARQIMHWNGNAFATQDGTEQDATSILNKIAQIERIMMVVSGKNYNFPLVHFSY